MSISDDYFINEMLLNCSSCGGELEYKGLGEFCCKECGNTEYNQYGKVRSFLEKYPGAPIDLVYKQTGVSKSIIRELLLESRIRISPDSKSFLKCELCGADIFCGRLCDACQQRTNRKIAPGNGSRRYLRDK